MKNEGIIKFFCQWLPDDPLEESRIEEINHWRDLLYGRSLLGITRDGIGYGNISVRSGEKGRFIITGSGTGVIPHLTGAHYTEVTSFDIDRNIVICRGPIEASSETLTHGVLYTVNKGINAVIHAHNKAIWESILNRVPTTSPELQYGTPELANDLKRLFYETNLSKVKIIALAGHPDGIISFGKSLEEAAGILLDLVV